MAALRRGSFPFRSLQFPFYVHLNSVYLTNPLLGLSCLIMTPTLYLIDGHAQIYRAYYAMESLKNAHGKPTGAAFGFARVIDDILDKHQPAALIAVFDAPGKTFRHDQYPAYKANRKPPPPELIEQIPIIQDIVRARNIPVYQKEGYEADDILGTLVRRAREAGWNAVLVTGDKDCSQLLQEGVRIYDSGKGVFLDVAAFIEKKGLPPDKLTDLMGLWGDSSDNIPGVPGIGEKIGVQLIKEYGSLENLLDHAGEIKGKRGTVLKENRELALLSKKLATIDQAVPIEFDLEAAKIHQPNVAELRRLYRDCGFKSLLNKLAAEYPDESKSADAKHVEIGTAKCLDPGPNENAASLPTDYRLVANGEDFALFLKELQTRDCFTFDTETTGLDPLLDRLVGLGFCWESGKAHYLPFLAPAGVAVLPASCLERLKPIFENGEVKKTGHNLRFDALVLRHAGIRLAGAFFDSLIASSLVGGHLVDHGLKTLARRHFDIDMTPIQDLIGSGRNQTSIDKVPPADVARYCGADADISHRLYREFLPQLESRGAGKLFREVEMPLSQVLTEMQATGIRLDCGLLAEESAETAELLENLTQEIHTLAGHEFNIASPKQLSAVLFEEMALPVLKRTQTGNSTDESVLQELANLHQSEICARILEYRMYAKLKNTYLDALPEMVNPETGRLHTTFSQVRTATGRLASSNPNLQNIPVRTERGRAVRAAFIPQAGWKMLAADYSQVELRVLAAFSGDPVLRKAFEDDLDIHRVVASEVGGIKPEEVTKSQRSAAKAVNFGIIYGQSAHGLAATTGMARSEAQRFIDDYFRRFPRIREWMDQALATAREKGFVETVLGFRREIPDIKATNHQRRSRAEREAINTIIQGSAADLIKTAMVDLARVLDRDGLQARLLLQIHDELLLEAPEGEIPDLKERVRGAMEQAIPFDVPLKVDIGIGDNWLETK